MFENRTDAGERLADRLEREGVEADLVLAIPRGGLPVGRAVADRLGLPLDVVSARKIGAPGNPELAVGAVASDGTVWLNDRLVDRLGVGRDYLDRAIDRERAAAREKVDRYRGDRPPLDVDGLTVLLVDDGLATGATATACVRLLREAGAERVVVAVPVAPPGTVERLADDADDVVAVETPASFRSVGGRYRSFDQVSDEEAIDSLRGGGD